MNRRDFLAASTGVFALPYVFHLKKDNQLCFSTLGCPDWTWKQIVENAQKMGFSAIEIRGIGKETDLWRCAEFQPNAIKDSIKMVKDAGLKIVNLGSSANLHFADSSKRKEQLDHAKKFIDLANELGCPYIRVFPNNYPKEFSKKETNDRIVSGLIELSDYAKGGQTEVLMETHGEVVWTTDLVEIMQKTNRKNVNLIWDFFNMYIVTRQKPIEMYAALKPYIRHAHLKDGIIEADWKFKYVFPAEGNSAIREVVEILRKDNYKGYYSFEWEKRWHPEIGEPEKAFPAFIEFMKK